MDNSKARAFLDRYAAIDWRTPRRDASGITAAYRNWLATLGLTRSIRVITDPAGALSATIGDGNWYAATQVTPGIVSLFPGHPLVRAMRPLLAQPPAVPPELDIAVVWACAFFFAAATAVKDWQAEFEADVNQVVAALARIAAAAPANLRALALLNTPLMGLFDPPCRIVSIVRDVLVAASDDALWSHLTNSGWYEELAKVFRLDCSSFRTPQRRDAIVDALISLGEPMLAACESGAFAHVFMRDELVVLVSPRMWTDGRRLHRADGPAIAWRKTKVYAWKGCVVPERFILAPETTRPDDVRAERDERVQRALVDLYACTHGHRRCIADFGGVMTQADETGRLWCVNPSHRILAQRPGDIKIVEVENGTAEPDGSHKTYWLAVPPDAQTAREAVAWTYGMTADDYDGLVQRT
jgi:hypothetical protein